MSLPWFRMYHEFAGDPVIQSLDFGDQRHFVMVLCLKAAGVLDRPMPSDEHRHRVISKALGLDALAAHEAQRRLRDVGLIDGNWQPVAWDRRQFKSDNSTARVQKFRASKNSEEEINPLKTDTEGNVTSNVSETFPAKKTATRTASRIPDDFDLTVERHAYAVKELPKVDAPSLFAEFVDHWKAASGATARKADWDATWRTWVRRAARYGYPMVHEAQVSQKQIRFDANGRQISG